MEGDLVFTLDVTKMKKNQDLGKRIWMRREIEMLEEAVGEIMKVIWWLLKRL